MKNWIIALAAETEDNIYYAPVTIAQYGELIPVQSTSDALTMDGYERAIDLVIAFGELKGIEITLPSGYNVEGKTPGLFITLMERSEWAAMPRLREEYDMVVKAMKANKIAFEGDIPQDVEILDEAEFIKRHASSDLYLKFEAERYGEAELERMGETVIDWNQFVVEA